MPRKARTSDGTIKEYKSLEVVNVRLVKESAMLSDDPIRDAGDATRLVQEFLKDFDREAFCILSLATDGKPISLNIASVGTLNSALVSPRETFKSCILSNAAGFIAYHCHPSGNPKPSREDAITTQRLKDAGNILDIKMVDHIIVGCGNDRSYSFAAHGLLSADSVLHAYENEFGSWER